MYNVKAEPYPLLVDLEVPRSAKNPTGFKEVNLPVIPIFSLMHAVYLCGAEQFNTTFPCASNYGAALEFAVALP